MKEWLPSSFFDLSGFSHREYFQSQELVWNLLAHLKSYIRTLPLGSIQTPIPSSAHLVHPELISIGEGTIIEPGVYIQGPCVIGSNCQVRFGAYIRGDVIVGDHSIVGHSTEVKHSILLNHAHAPHFNYVGDSILGNRVNLGAGVKCANYPLIRTTVKIQFKDQKLDTQLTKLGAIIGDGCAIGCNTTLNPGTLMGQNVICYPNVATGGVIPARSRIKQVLKK